MKRVLGCLVFWSLFVFLVLSQQACQKKGAAKRGATAGEAGCEGCFEGQRCLEGACDGIGTISVSSLHAKLSKKDFQLLNVLDFHAGTIPGTDAHIPFTQIDEILKHLGPQKKQPVVVYCRSLPKARMASKKLFEKGYRNIAVLKGGVRAWKKAGYELEK